MRNRPVVWLVFIAGAVASASVIGAVLFALAYYQVTPRQLTLKIVERAGFGVELVDSLWRPSYRYVDHKMDGRLKAVRPRILLSELSQWDGMGVSPVMEQRKVLHDAYGMSLAEESACGIPDVLPLAVCWLTTAKPGVAEQLVKALKTFEVEVIDGSKGRYGRGWEVAFAYDLLGEYDFVSSRDRRLIESKIEKILIGYLNELDKGVASLWHGRASLAAEAWISAVALGADESATRRSLVLRAQGNFLDTVRAMRLTEAWPEGYNYWIQSRALVLSLASSAYINGLEAARHKETVTEILRRIGLWHIYATRPDNQIEGLGDEGSRVDLKDETRRVIDVIAQVTREPVFAIYSRYLERLHGADSYYGGYHWGFPLFNDPTVVGSENAVDDLEVLNGLLPESALFGRRALNLSYIRSGWNSGDTFISYKAGHIFTHHGHYDAGHFSLFKGAPLAINSSSYGDYTGDNRLHYSIRTVAKNSILVQKPDELVQPNRFFKQNVADGGQRVVFPTGSALQSVADWQQNLGSGAHLEGANLLSYDHVAGDYTYLASDLTPAYNNTSYDETGEGGKVSSVLRSLVYLHQEDRLVLFDRVSSTEPGFKKKWLLHTVNKPDMSNLKVVVGSAENGILQSNASIVRVRNGEGRLQIQRVLPENATIRLVGGKDYQFYVEADGDDSALDGVNFSGGAAFKPWFDIGSWRVEVQPTREQTDDEFLISLLPAIGEFRTETLRPLEVGNSARAVYDKYAIYVFVKKLRDTQLSFSTLSTHKKVYFFGLPARRRVDVKFVDKSSSVKSNAQGVIVLPLLDAAGSGKRIVASW